MLKSWVRSSAILLALAVSVGACGDASSPFGDDAVAIRASSDLGVGRERLLIGISQADGTRVGSPEDAVTFEIAPVDDPGVAQTVEATFTWIVEPAVGLYRAEVDFDRPGTWQATVVPATGAPLEPVLFTVFAEPLTPAVGAPAPAPPTPTLDDLPIEELTTDPNPERRFYEVSLDEAIAASEPTVVVFSTPAYCQTAACGPLLETVKGVAPEYPEVTFIHVEVFTGLTDPDFVPDAAHLAPAVTDQWYRLPSEPWIFVIDRTGLIAARYEGVVDSAELEDALAKISL